MEVSEQISDSIPYNEVSLGYRTVSFFSEDELTRGQIGYSVDNSGRPLTGNANGDWREEWVVIGYEDQCGDPIFIDTSEPNQPVFTAINGEAKWKPIPIAVSLKNFIICLSYIKELSVGRENPVALEKRPISPPEKDRVLKLIVKDNNGISLDFWEIWLEA